MENLGFLIISTFLLLFTTLLPYSSASTTRRFHFNVSKFRQIQFHVTDMIILKIWKTHTAFIQDLYRL